MKSKLIHIPAALAILLCFTGCTKEEITEVTEVNNFFTEWGVEIYVWEQNANQSIEISDNNDWDLSDLIGFVEIGALDSGDVVILESQFRLFNTSCQQDINVVSTPLLASSITDTPQFAASESWLQESNFQYFFKNEVIEVSVDSEENVAGLRVNVIREPCAGDATELALAKLVVTLVRSNQ